MLLELDNVRKEYPRPGGAAPLVVLDGVSLELEAGEALAVIGPSGSGKSTLLNLMGALDRPTTGAVRLGGADLARLDDVGLAAVRSRDVGFVFQLHHLLPQCTLLENCLLPTLATAKARRAEAAARALRLLGRVGLEERADHLPGQLSGGECQRAAVVRALVNRPRLLLADEPTGSLDGATATALADLLVELNREEGVALVVVTHAGDLARRMGRMSELARGELREAR